MNTREPAQADRKPPAAPRLLEACRDLAAGHLGRVLPSLMDRVDDALFDLSDKGENNEIQSLYFDAMREVRLKRPSIEAAFKVAFLELANEKIRRKPAPSSPPPATEVSEQELSLVEEGDLEESLAVTNMSSKIRALCRRELFGLEKRIALLLGVSELDGEDNPLGPEVVCRAFREACGELESGIKVKLLILKLFDRFVIGEVEALYRSLNEHLVARDVLPSIRTMIRKRPATPRRLPPRGAAEESPPRLDGAPDLAGPGGAMATVHPLPVSALPVPGGAAPGGPTGFGHAAGAGGAAPDVLTALLDYMRGNEFSGGHGVGSGELVEPTRLVAELTALQRRPADSVSWIDSGAGPDPGGNAGPSLLRALKADASGVGLGPGDELLLDIVAMLFDYILDDKDLPDPMKALLGRLQIPILKVAILDKTFFSRRFHPARKLLNQLAEAGLGWSDGEGGDVSLYAKIEAVVNRILDEFDDDVRLFSELSAELDAFLVVESEQAEENLRRSTELAERQERLALAKREAERVVRRAIDGVAVPPPVEQFLTRYWQGLLVVTNFNEGAESSAWAADCRTVERLVWSIRPCGSEAEREELVAALPELLARLQEGMERIAMPPDERAGLIAELAGCHAAVVKPSRGDQVAGSPMEREALSDRADGTEPADRVGQVVSIDSAWAAPPLPPEPLPGPLPEPPPEPTSRPAGTAAGETTPPPAADPDPDGCWRDAIRAAIDDANRAVFDASRRNPRYQGMGTTVVAAAFDRDRLSFAHVGDSRLYRLRGGRLDCLTADHSVVQELVNRGFYTPEQAEQAVNKNLVTRGMGVDATVEADLGEVEVEPDDLYLACSDGLTDMITDEQIRAIIRRYTGDLLTGAEKLIKAANDGGGVDNISVILAAVRKSSGPRWFGKRRVATRVEMVCRSDVGRKRAHNEDSVAADPARGIFVLADGMGGMKAGEVASAMTVQMIMEGLGAWADGAADGAPPAADPPAPPAVPAADDPAPPAVPAADDPALPAVLAADDPALGPNDIDLFAIEAPSEGEPDEAAEAAMRALLAPLADENHPPLVGPEGGLGERAEAATRAGPAVSPPGDDPEAAGAAIEEIEVLAVGELAANPSEDEHDHAVRELAIGTWVEFIDEYDNPTRARLAWVSSATNRYLFTDRRGMRAADKSAEGLGVELRRGSARIIEQVPLYDRAVSSLMERLKGTQVESG